MLLEVGDHQLLIEQAPHFRLTSRRSGNVYLRTAPHSQPVLAVRQTDASLSIEFPGVTLSVAVSENGYELQAFPPKAVFSLSFEMAGSWYGHGELVHQQYPLNRLMLQESPFQTNDNGPDGQSCVLNPAWFSSRGCSIAAHTPVSVGINQPPGRSPYSRRGDGLPAEEYGLFSNRPPADPGNSGDGHITFSGAGLHLSIRFSEDARAAFRHLVGEFGFPTETPPESLFTLPTWTTWARYKTAISHDVVLEFAEEIVRHGYLHGVMEIDDGWQVHYGDIAFDPVRFPDPRRMIGRLHDLGFKVTTWVVPFLEPESRAFAEGREKGYLVRQRDGEPYLVSWWHGHGALLDVTNPSCLEWFHTRLESLRADIGLDGYKFDAGEAAFFPADGLSAVTIHPNEYTHRYVDFVSRHYRLTEVRAGWCNQRAPIFFRQWDKWSTWGLDNGLHSVLTGLLSLGLSGYPFILPDMIGGNAYDAQADAELLVRWTQLNALLPAMQFSLAPWDFGDECDAICRRYAELHREFARRILAAASVSTQTGEPIIRPLWWLAPHDERALTCDDEFLLGDDLLVAPVIKPGARARDIYLPPGKWRDHWTGRGVGSGPVKAYPAPLNVLPVFEREA
jgi:alpha-glucosidase (family GH31 glycosyl hydrolase)